MTDSLDIDAFAAMSDSARCMATAFEQFALATGNIQNPLHALVEFWRYQEESELDAEPLGELSEPQHLSRFGLFEPE